MSLWCQAVVGLVCGGRLLLDQSVVAGCGGGLWLGSHKLLSLTPAKLMASSVQDQFFSLPWQATVTSPCFVPLFPHKGTHFSPCHSATASALPCLICHPTCRMVKPYGPAGESGVPSYRDSTWVEAVREAGKAEQLPREDRSLLLVDMLPSDDDDILMEAIEEDENGVCIVFLSILFFQNAHNFIPFFVFLFPFPPLPPPQSIS